MSFAFVNTPGKAILLGYELLREGKREVFAAFRSEKALVGTLIGPPRACHVIRLRKHPRQGHPAGLRTPPRSNARGLRGPVDSIRRTQPQNDLCGAALLHCPPSRDPSR